MEKCEEGKIYYRDYQLKDEQTIDNLYMWGASNSTQIAKINKIFNQNLTFSTCCIENGVHIHKEILSSSKFQPKIGQEVYVLYSTGVLPYYCKSLIGVKLYENILVQYIQDLPIVQEVILKSDTEKKISLKFPIISKTGLKIPILIQKVSHSIYGEIFSKTCTIQILQQTPPQWGLITSNTHIKLTKTTNFYRIPKQYCSFFSPSHVFKQGSLHELSKTLVSLGRKFQHKITPVFISSPRGCGKRAVCYQAASSLGIKILQFSLFNYSTYQQIENLFQKIKSSSPCLVHIRQFTQAIQIITFGQPDSIHVLYDKFSTLFQTQIQHPVLLIVSSSTTPSLPSRLRNFFIKLKLPPPTQYDRQILFNRLFSIYSLDLNPQQFSRKTPGKSTKQILTIVKHIKLCQKEDDIFQILKKGKTSIPNVQWEDIGGLAAAKQDIIDTIELPFKKPELYTKGIRGRSGLLLYGPPGTGKTLLAKAVATQLSLNFIPVKGPELLNMYIGQSQKNIRNLFSEAKNSEPCILFFDQLDSIAPVRGKGSDTGGVMDRIVSQLLTEIDSLESRSQMFIVGATNRPDLLDPNLLRPGRFDKQIELGVPNDQDSKLQILEALTRKFLIEDRCDLREVVQRSQGFSGADFYALASSALSEAYQEKAVGLEERWREEGGEEDLDSFLCCQEDLQVEVSNRHFFRALDKVRPSLTASEIRKYARK